MAIDQPPVHPISQPSVVHPRSGDFYARALHSPAYATFCRRVYGQDLCQTGWADMAQLKRLLTIANLRHGQHALELGCGLGLIAEYLSDASRAHFTGLDDVPLAIEQALERTRGKRRRLVFHQAQLDALPASIGPFDLILAVDTLHRPHDLTETLKQLKALLAPHGQIAAFYGHSACAPLPDLPASLRPDGTPLAEALRQNGLRFETWDLTEAGHAIALSKQQAAEELRLAFAAEGNCCLYEHLAAEARAVVEASEAGCHARYLYRANL